MDFDRLIDHTWSIGRERLLERRPGIEESEFDLPDGVNVVVKLQFSVVRVLIRTRKGKRQFEILVVDERDIRPDEDEGDVAGNFDPYPESLSIPRVKHRRTWNGAAGRTVDSAARRRRSETGSFDLNRVDSIVIGRTSTLDQTRFFLAVRFLGWNLCPSIQPDLLAIVRKYLGTFRVPWILSQDYGSRAAFLNFMAGYVVDHLREPQHPHDVNKYIAATIRGFKQQALKAALKESHEPMSRTQSEQGIVSVNATDRLVFAEYKSGLEKPDPKFDWPETPAALTQRMAPGLTVGETATVREAAAILGYTEQHLYRLIKTRKLKAREVKKRLVIDAAEIDRHWSNQRTQRLRQGAINRLMQEFNMQRDAARKAVYRFEKSSNFRMTLERYREKKRRELGK